MTRLRRLLPSGGCKGITKRGQPCQGKDVYENGFCKHHGGAGKSLVHRRLAMAITRDLEKVKRLDRRLAKWERQNPAFAKVMEAARFRRENEDPKP